MSQNFKGSLVVAVGFDDRTPDLVATAKAFARQFSLNIHLVHAIEPPVYDVMAVETPAVVTLPLVVQHEMARMLREREEQMGHLVRVCNQEGTATTGVTIEGDPVRMIIHEAIRLRAGLILTANNMKSDDYFPLGFSTTLGLMHDAPLPVLALGQKPLDRINLGVKCLIADDLTEGSREAAQKTYEFASLIPNCKVRHVHVHGDIRESLKDTWRDLRGRLPFMQKQDATPESIWHSEFEARLGALRLHGLPWRRKAEDAGVSIETDVRTGDVETELTKVINDFSPDIVVFGRHRLLKSRPFLIGRMPARLMMKDQRTVLLVPPTKDLYAKIPFPCAPV